MKRVLLIAVFLFLFFLPISVKAECNYEEQNELNTLASNINYTYKYVRDVYIFDVTLYNVTKDLYVKLNDKQYTSKNGQISLNNVSASKNNIVKIYSSDSTGCPNDELNTLNLNLPFYNLNYSKDLCIENPNTNYCVKYSVGLIDEDELLSSSGKIKSEQTDEELEEYLNNKKETNIVTIVKKQVVNIFTIETLVLVVLIILIILFIIYFIKRIKRNMNLKF